MVSVGLEKFNSELTQVYIRVMPTTRSHYSFVSISRDFMVATFRLSRLRRMPSLAQGHLDFELLKTPILIDRSDYVASKYSQTLE